MSALDVVFIGLGIFVALFAFGAVGCLLSDWLESREWFIDWHRKHYQGRFVERKRNMATRRRKA